jgi:hypothetical protein
MSASGLIERRWDTRASGIPKVLNSSEDAHVSNMSIFETDEHLRGCYLNCELRLCSISQAICRVVAKCGGGLIGLPGPSGGP